MSLIGKNPFVNEVLTSCSAEQLTSLSALINNLGSPTVIKLKELKNTDKGVKYASVFLDDFTLVHGLWIYTDTKCGLFAFQNGFDEMQAIRIDTVNKNYEYVYQHLSAIEFRSTLDDVANSSGGGEVPSDLEVDSIKANEAEFGYGTTKISDTGMQVGSLDIDIEDGIMYGDSLFRTSRMDIGFRNLIQEEENGAHVWIGKLVAYLPSQFEEENSQERTATEEEQQWIKNNYDALIFFSDNEGKWNMASGYTSNGYYHLDLYCTDVNRENYEISVIAHFNLTYDDNTKQLRIEYGEL